jgi:hypothetical protein
MRSLLTLSKLFQRHLRSTREDSFCESRLTKRTGVFILCVCMYSYMMLLNKEKEIGADSRLEFLILFQYFMIRLQGRFEFSINLKEQILRQL